MSESLYTGLQALSGADYTSCHHVGDVIDSDVLRTAYENDRALPTAGDAERDKYLGAIVFDPQPGIHRNVMYPDFSSLYPLIMLDLNASPETIIGVGEGTLEERPYTEDDVRWGWIDTRPVKRLSAGETYNEYTDGEYKIVYDPNKNDIKWTDNWERIKAHTERVFFQPPEENQGLLPSRAETYIRWNKSYSGTMYKATKRQRNGLYGVSGDNNFRLFDWRVAEAITLAGRYMLREAARYLTRQLGHDFERDSVYTTHGDTDGFGLAVDVEYPRSEILRSAAEAIDELESTKLPNFMQGQFGVPTDDCSQQVDLESYAARLFIPASGGNPSNGGVKKTYVERITLDEADAEEADVSVAGQHFEEDNDISITGFRAIRSDVAELTVDVQTQVLEAVVTEPQTEARQTAYEVAQNAVEKIRNEEYDLEYLGRRNGLSKDCREYGSESRSPQPAFRGAKYAHKHIDGEDFSDGGKPMLFPVDRVGGGLPSTYQADTAEDGDLVDYVAVENPSNLPDSISLDTEGLIADTIEKPLQDIFGTLGWRWDDVVDEGQQSTFDSLLS